MEKEKLQGTDSPKTVSALKTAEDVKTHLENQLKQTRMAAQQVRKTAQVSGHHLFNDFRRPRSDW